MNEQKKERREEGWKEEMKQGGRKDRMKVERKERTKEAGKKPKKVTHTHLLHRNRWRHGRAIAGTDNILLRLL